MNRLIIIGNGFDLAHGLKTSFKHFIEDYFKNSINEFYKNGIYLGELLEIKFEESNKWYDNSGIVDEDRVFEEFRELKGADHIVVNFKSDLLETIYNDFLEKNWVDIEIVFFLMLKAIKEREDIDKCQSYDTSEDLDKLNKDFDRLKKKLMKYLIDQQSKFENNFQNTPLLDCFREQISEDEILKVEDFLTQEPENLCFLNFNYTNTIESYYRVCNSCIPSELNYIHGSLDGKNGNPIFGFGDEMDKEYLEFEDLDDKRYFKHIKSFEYSLNQNYHSLMRFIESDDFQVHIYGHSCGLSDRTMLNKIFENDHCKSIKIFYYGKDIENNDFIDKTYDIYRHFKDKALVRDKLVSREICRAMPQPYEEYELSKS